MQPSPPTRSPTPDRLDAGEIRRILESARHQQLAFHRSGRVRSLRFGDSPSAILGEGLEFGEVRRFTPGDRVRHVHPAATSRAQDLMVRKFIEPREALVLLLIDVSPSMYLREKMRTALGAAGIIASSAHVQHMPLGLWAVGSSSAVELPPRSGEGNFHRLMDLLTDVLGAADGSELVAAHRIEWAHRKLERFLSRGSFLFVISDFLGGDDVLRSAMRNEAFAWYATPVIVQDALEHSFPVFPRHGAAVPLTDAETLETRETWIDRAGSLRIRAVHEERFARLCAQFVEHHRGFVHADSPDLGTIFMRLQDALS